MERTSEADRRPVAKQQRERYENQVGQVPVGTPERALIDQLQPYHNGAGFRAYALGIPRDLNNHDKHRELILQVVVVNPKVRVFLGDSAGDEVMTADFDGVSGDGKPGTDTMGFTIRDIRRQLVTNAAFLEFGTAKNQRVVSSVSFLFQYARNTVQRFRPLAQPG